MVLGNLYVYHLPSGLQAPSPPASQARDTQLQSLWLWSSRLQMTPGLRFILCWKFQNAGLFCLVAILNQSEKFEEHMKHMELPQNSGKCWVEIMPSPRLVSACVTLGHNYNSVCVCPGQIAWNSACAVPPLRVVCFQQQMGGGWGGCGVRNAGVPEGSRLSGGILEYTVRKKIIADVTSSILLLGKPPLEWTIFWKMPRNCLWAVPPKPAVSWMMWKRNIRFSSFDSAVPQYPPCWECSAPGSVVYHSPEPELFPSWAASSESLWSIGAEGKLIPHSLVCWFGSQSSSLRANKGLMRGNPSGSSALHLLAWISPVSEIQAFESNL